MSMAMSTPLAVKSIGARQGFAGSHGKPASGAVKRAAAGRRGVVVRAEAAKEEKFDARAFRRFLGSEKTYTRRFKNDPEAAAQMEEQGIMVSKGGVIAKMRESGFSYVNGDVTLKLADAYGFCWGVERAVQMAYEARKQHPDAKLWITNEIIHNPTVNQRLDDMGVNFIEDTSEGKDFSPVENGEVVILPAFGASVQEMKLLHERGVNIVDTTCPWVSKVWNAVDTHKKKEHTSIIHGKYSHEETVATASFADKYLIVKDMKEATWVADWILNGGSTEEFMEKFKNAISEGFNPEVDLDAVGIANQTTMLKGETEAIGKLFERTMMEKYGVGELNQHYMVMDTICDATQERQDAMYKLVDEKPDIMLVVGGFNSSNTSHLQEISEDYSIPSFWVDVPERIDVNNKILHRLSHGELVETDNWLPEGPVVIGVTSGASTPDKVVEDCIDIILQTKANMGSAVSA